MSEILSPTTSTVRSKMPSRGGEFWEQLLKTQISIAKDAPPTQSKVKFHRDSLLKLWHSWWLLQDAGGSQAATHIVFSQQISVCLSERRPNQNWDVCSWNSLRVRQSIVEARHCHSGNGFWLTCLNSSVFFSQSIWFLDARNSFLRCANLGSTLWSALTVFQATLVRSAGKNLEEDAPVRSLRKVTVGRVVGQLVFCYWIIEAIGSVSPKKKRRKKTVGCCCCCIQTQQRVQETTVWLLEHVLVMMKSLMIMDHRHESWSSTSSSRNKSSNIIVKITFEAVNFLS